MVNNRQSRHLRLYSQARHLLQRKAGQVIQAEDEELSKVMADCTFRPMTRPYRRVKDVVLPKGAPSVVSRLRKATEERQDRAIMLNPRVPIVYSDRRSNIHQPTSDNTAVLVEIVRDGPTPEADCVNLGAFMIDKNTNPASLAQGFGQDYGLTAPQVMRLERKLRINMQTIFRQ
jgi:hypothetical protein